MYFYAVVSDGYENEKFQTINRRKAEREAAERESKGYKSEVVVCSADGKKHARS